MSRYPPPEMLRCYCVWCKACGGTGGRLGGYPELEEDGCPTCSGTGIIGSMCFPCRERLGDYL